MRHDDLIGAWVATVIFTLCALVFIARLAGRERVEYWLGAGLLVMAALAMAQHVKLGL
jgi:hypothetical protein